MVVYQNVHQPEKIWTRLEEEFFDEVKVIDKIVKRFEIIV